MAFLDFEKPILEMESKIKSLKGAPGDSELNIADEVARIQKKLERLMRETYSNLTAAQKVQVARHPNRPHCLDYVRDLITDFTPLAGDRVFAEDAAMISGFGRFHGQSVAVLGQEKGHDTESRIHHNFGMAKPDGYRKAQRIMEIADRFSIPVISLVDTAGAYPGVGAEERGQSEAIAKSIQSCLRVKAPFVSTIIGEGGSGGAIAIAAADRVLMLEHSVYSVISPEGCASILWRSGEYAKDAAEALKLTAQDLLKLAVIDGIIEEPMGGAHRDKKAVVQNVGQAIKKHLVELSKHDGAKLVALRRQKFLDMGQKSL